MDIRVRIDVNTREAMEKIHAMMQPADMGDLVGFSFVAFYEGGGMDLLEVGIDEDMAAAIVEEYQE